MDMIVIASFVGFFGMVLAWLAAPSGAKRAAVIAESATAGAD